MLPDRPHVCAMREVFIFKHLYSQLAKGCTGALKGMVTIFIDVRLG